MTRYIAVSGSNGFIGRHVVRKLLARGDYVYAIDRLDYAAGPPITHERFQLQPVDVRTLGRFPDVDAVIHLAASTHVDNSFNEAEEFVANNVGGTAKMLELVRAKSQHGAPHYVHVSTDEVYGPASGGAFGEWEPLKPTSPYAASKAAADMLVRAWGETYDLRYTILRPTNCYGVGQYPEKLIPKAVRAFSLVRKMPVHGDGKQTRCWLNVEDAADAIILAVDRELQGIFNVGGNCEASVDDVLTAIKKSFSSYPIFTTYGYTRPACDLRYAVDDNRLRNEGWRPTGAFWRDLPAIVEAERKQWRW